MSIIGSIGSVGKLVTGAFTGGSGLIWAAIGGAILFTAYTGYVYHLGGNGPRAERDAAISERNTALAANASLTTQLDAQNAAVALLKKENDAAIAASAERVAKAKAVSKTFEAVIASYKAEAGKPTAKAEPIQKIAEIRALLFGAADARAK